MNSETTQKGQCKPYIIQKYLLHLLLKHLFTLWLFDKNNKIKPAFFLSFQLHLTVWLGGWSLLLWWHYRLCDSRNKHVNQSRFGNTVSTAGAIPYCLCCIFEAGCLANQGVGFWPHLVILVWSCSYYISSRIQLPRKVMWFVQQHCWPHSHVTWEEWQLVAVMQL